MSRLKTFKHSESGQAVTEYILVLVVVVAIIMGGMYQLNTAFQVWANNYFGEYLTCLLETGELPSIGGTPGDSGICNESFKAFSFTEGRPKDPPTDPGDDDEDDPPKESRGGDEDGRGARESGGRGSYVSSSGSSGSGRMGKGRSSFARSQNITASSKEKEKYTGSTESSMPAGYGSSSSRNKNGRPQFVRIDHSRIVDAEEKKERERKTSSSVKSDAGGGQTQSGRIKLNKRDIASTTEAKDEPFTIGNFFRLLIIAAIIIALVVLLGGQALQISKGSD